MLFSVRTELSAIAGGRSPCLNAGAAALFGSDETPDWWPDETPDWWPDETPDWWPDETADWWLDEIADLWIVERAELPTSAAGQCPCCEPAAGLSLC